jgi:hypothetical protein
MNNDLNKILEEINVIYEGKKRNIKNITEENNSIKNQFKEAETNNLLYKDYLKLKERQLYLEKRLPIEINELRGVEIARKILTTNINTEIVEEEYIEDMRLSKDQMNIIADKFETTEWGWYGDGCNCGEFQIEITGVGFLVVDRSCRKSSSTPDGMQFSFGNIISVYNKSILDPKYNEPYMHDDFEEQGIVCIGDINAKQTRTILEYAKENTIRDLGYDEYGNEVN